MVAYLKKILKTGNRRGNEMNGSGGSTPRKSTGSVPDLLMGVDVSELLSLKFHGQKYHL